MSIPPESPWRGAAAFLPQPVSDEYAAKYVVGTIYQFNARKEYSITPPLADIEYRSSDKELDIRRHVFRWDRAHPHKGDYIVFERGFEARRQEGTPNGTYHNLETYVNSGGRPLGNGRETTYAFVSTTINSGWVPKVNSGIVDHVYRYEIYAPGGILVAETLGDRYQFPAQKEIAFPAGIAPQYIRSAQLFELRMDRQFPRKRRVDNTLFINTNFNPQAYPQRELKLQRPIGAGLVVQEYPERRLKRAISDIIDYYIEGVTKNDSYIDSAFRSTRNNEVYMFIKTEYASASTDGKVIRGPFSISTGYPSLVGTSFAAYGIDAAFSCHGGVDEAFIFSSNLCAKIKYAPGTTNDKILEGPKTIRQMFPFLKGTNFEKGVDAAFESSVNGEAYLFNGPQYALIDYSKRSLIAISLITQGFVCLKNTIFASDIGAAVASHKSNEVYLFKDNKYVLLHFTPGTKKGKIIDGPKDIVPNNWPSLKNILPRKNQADPDDLN